MIKETRKQRNARKKTLQNAQGEKRTERASAKRRGYDHEWRKFRLNFARHWISYGKPCDICGHPLDPIDLSLLDVDHVIPIRERPDLRFEPRNCRVLHRSCHSRRTSQYEVDAARGYSTAASSNGNPQDPRHPWNEVRADGAS